MNTGGNYIINSRLCKFESIRQIIFLILYQCKCLQGGCFACGILNISNGRHHEVFLCIILSLQIAAQHGIRMSNHRIIRSSYLLSIQQLIQNLDRLCWIASCIRISPWQFIVKGSMIHKSIQWILIGFPFFSVLIIGSRNRIILPKTGICIIISS